MIAQNFLERQIRRMAGLDDFPKFAPEAEGELVLIAAKYARSEAHLHGVINEIMAVWTKCPKPAELRAQLDLGRGEFVNADCLLCRGSGWRIVEKDGQSGAARCQCGSVPAAPGAGIRYSDARRAGHTSGLTSAKDIVH